ILQKLVVLHANKRQQSRTDAIKDHRGLPLSPAALEMATEYWNCQREYELCPLDAEDQIYGPQQQSDPLLRQARFRREYTRLIFGLDVLPPGARTFEPPYIAAAPAHILPSLKPSPMARPAPSQFPSAQPTEHALPDEQSQIVKLAESGQNIFFTGSAGTGKSTVLHAIRKRLEDLGKNVAVMAPTGKVALAINGTTTWTYCGWTPDAYKRTLEQLRRSAGSRHIRSRFEKTDVIIIDEISMVENLHFERMNAVIKHGRKTPKLPFGGLQVIVTGDFCQLPPVKPFSHCMKCGQEMKMNYLSKETGYVCPKACQEPYKDSDKWAFKSAAWKECNFVNVLLTAIHRQHDACFISLLQKCRMGIQLHQEEIDLLIDHPCDTTNAVKLFATREEVRKVNQEEYDRLYTIEHRYHAYDDFYWERDAHPNLGSKATRSKDDCLNALSDHRFDPNVWLKEGMLVVLLVNLDLSQGLCNGSQGVIVGFQPYDPKDLPRRGSKGTGSRDFLGGMLGAHGAIKDDHVNRFCRYQIDTGRVPLEWPIVKFHNGVTATIFPECQVNEIGDVKPYSLLCRTQMPLAPAWALSIHRSQGMTLDRVIVDLSRIFEEGQMYVALSRAT
ncbi:P-loop containing nucleoside triphosphate hydrolase protein, partial [Echria macrotheca]